MQNDEYCEIFYTYIRFASAGAVCSYICARVRDSISNEYGFAGVSGGRKGRGKISRRTRKHLCVSKSLFGFAIIPTLNESYTWKYDSLKALNNPPLFVSAPFESGDGGAASSCRLLPWFASWIASAAARVCSRVRARWALRSSEWIPTPTRRISCASASLYSTDDEYVSDDSASDANDRTVLR